MSARLGRDRWGRPTIDDKPVRDAEVALSFHISADDVTAAGKHGGGVATGTGQPREPSRRVTGARPAIRF